MDQLISHLPWVAGGLLSVVPILVFMYVVLTAMSKRVPLQHRPNWQEMWASFIEEHELELEHGGTGLSELVTMRGAVLGSPVTIVSRRAHLNDDTVAATTIEVAVPGFTSDLTISCRSYPGLDGVRHKTGERAFDRAVRLTASDAAIINRLDHDARRELVRLAASAPGFEFTRSCFRWAAPTLRKPDLTDPIPQHGPRIVTTMAAVAHALVSDSTSATSAPSNATSDVEAGSRVAVSKSAR